MRPDNRLSQQPADFPQARMRKRTAFLRRTGRFTRLLARIGIPARLRWCPRNGGRQTETRWPDPLPRFRPRPSMKRRSPTRPAQPRTPQGAEAGGHLVQPSRAGRADALHLRPRADPAGRLDDHRQGGRSDRRGRQAGRPPGGTDDPRHSEGPDRQPRPHRRWVKVLGMVNATPISAGMRTSSTASAS